MNPIYTNNYFYKHNLVILINVNFYHIKIVVAKEAASFFKKFGLSKE